MYTLNRSESEWRFALVGTVVYSYNDESFFAIHPTCNKMTHRCDRPSVYTYALNVGKTYWTPILT